MSEQRAYNLRQAAELLGIHHATLRRWIDDGIGPRAFIHHNTQRATIRITATELAAFQRSNSRGATR